MEQFRFGIELFLKVMEQFRFGIELFLRAMEQFRFGIELFLNETNTAFKHIRVYFLWK